jgi:hypothetical protein
LAHRPRYWSNEVGIECKPLRRSKVGLVMFVVARVAIDGELRFYGVGGHAVPRYAIRNKRLWPVGAW